MDKDIIEQLNSRLSKLNKLIAYVEDNLSSLPEGNLIIRQEGDKLYYYAKPENTRHRIPISDSKQINSLAQRSYLLKIKRSADGEKKLIEQLLMKCKDRPFEEIYDSLPESRRHLISPVWLPDRLFIKKWLSIPYDHKPFYDGDPYFVTERGERVRSKSEQLIANRLYSRGVPYKYEHPLTLGGKIVHPDFTILRISDRKEIYYEHLGKMGDEDYAFKTIRKIDKYAANRIVLGERLFTTMESNKAPLDLRTLDKLIDTSFR